MSGPGVGFEYPPQQVTWLQRDALLFANSIGVTPEELHFLYVRFPAPSSNSCLASRARRIRRAQDSSVGANM